jgi:D-apionolactonase
LLAEISHDQASRNVSEEGDMGQERTGPVAFSAAVSRYGKDEPLPARQDVRAGPLTAVLEGGDLRYVKLGAETVVLRLYAAIRDLNWDTIEPRFLSYELDQEDDRFSVRFVAENVANDVAFEWQGSITGTPDGVITATMDGVARKTFLKNRIGWCILHPMALAGVHATVETPDGAVEGSFPDLISPHQPFIDMQSIAHATAGGEIVIRFEGDLWEMEDQRNWTDASFKTYSTPLRLPYPVEIHEGDRVWQRVTIEARGGDAAMPATGGPLRVAVDPARGRTIPPIGLGVAGHGAPLGEEDVALLRALQPAHLHLTLDLTESGWRESLARAQQEAAALGAALAIEAIAGAGGAGLPDLAAALSGSEVDVARVLVFADGELVTDETVLTAAREALSQAGVETLVGGGSRAFFTELNRATLPLDAMDVVSYTLNPQVHAFDNASLTETLAAQPETVRSARAIVGERPLVVGPITLRPRFNPNATGPEPKPAPGELPSSVDYRQPSLFAAGWLSGSINALGNAGVDGLIYFETTGWKGLIERRDHPLRVAGFHSWPGMVFPVYHVLADVADFQHGQILPVTLGDGLRVQALALRDGDQVRVILANMGDELISVALEIPGAGDVTVRRLDDGTVHLAATDPAAFRASTQPIGGTDGTVMVDLPPFGLATVDVKSAAL